MQLTERGALGSRSMSCRSPDIVEQVPKSPNVFSALCMCHTQHTEYKTGSRRSYCCIHGSCVGRAYICILSAMRRNYRFSFGGPLPQYYTAVLLHKYMPKYYFTSTNSAVWVLSRKYVMELYCCNSITLQVELYCLYG